MRKPLIAGNWKLNNTIAEATQLAETLTSEIGTINCTDIVVAPVFTALASVTQICASSTIQVAGQNCHCVDSGAFTGEVSAPLLVDAGCSHVIIGHSERRQYFGETDNFVNAKTHAAINAGLTAIVCLGETLEQRESGEMFDIITNQLSVALNEIIAEQTGKLVIAYEPIWAIGTGKTATPEQAKEVHKAIREYLARFDADIAQTLQIVYGGSVKPDNADAIFAQLDVDGALVGGASLNSNDFVKICNAAG